MGEATTGPQAAPNPSRRHRWRRCRIGLRGMMAVVVVVGGVMALVRRELDRRDALAKVRAAGGYITFADEQPGPRASPGWRWFHQVTGIVSFRPIHMIDLQSINSGTLNSPFARYDAGYEALGRLGKVDLVSMTDGLPMDRGLARLAAAPIDRLQLPGAGPISADALAGLARCRQIKGLCLWSGRYYGINSAYDRAVGELTQLESLALSGRAIDPLGAELTPLGRLRNLKRLHVSELTLDERGLAALDPLDRMEDLSLGLGNRLDDATLRRLLDHMPRLTKFTCLGAALSNNQLSLDDEAGLTDATLRRLVDRLPGLTSLSISGSALTDAGVEALTRFPGLEAVALRGGPGATGRLTDAGLAALARIPTLRRLTVTCGRFTAAGLDALRPRALDELGLGAIEPGAEAALGRLVAGRAFSHLTLQGPGVTDAVVPALAGSLGPRSTLDLSGSAVTDAAAPALARLPVEAILLSRTALTDAGLATFAAGMAARALNAGETRITPAGAAAFRAARPDRRLFAGDQ